MCSAIQNEMDSTTVQAICSRCGRPIEGVAYVQDWKLKRYHLSCFIKEVGERALGLSPGSLEEVWEAYKEK